MKKLLLLLCALILTLTFVDSPMGASKPEAVIPFPEVPRISAKETRVLLGDPDVAIIDARPVEQWKFSDQLIQGAVHEDPFEVDFWINKYRKDQTLIIYCA